jgi:hypothetical protein
MKDHEAINILGQKHVDDIKQWSSAIAHAGNRLIDCQWHDYIKGSHTTPFCCDLLLDVWFDDESHGTFCGTSIPRKDEDGNLYFSLEVDNCKDGTVKHWMKFPEYKD